MSLVNVTSRADALACSLLNNAHAASIKRNNAIVLDRIILEDILLLPSRPGF
jgi:hypothetical protein